MSKVVSAADMGMTARPNRRSHRETSSPCSESVDHAAFVSDLVLGLPGQSDLTAASRLVAVGQGRSGTAAERQVGPKADLRREPRWICSVTAERTAPRRPRRPGRMAAVGRSEAQLSTLSRPSRCRGARPRTGHSPRVALDASIRPKAEVACSR